jgi:hypothetical protein
MTVWVNAAARNLRPSMRSASCPPLDSLPFRMTSVQKPPGLTHGDISPSKRAIAAAPAVR